MSVTQSARTSGHSASIRIRPRSNGTIAYDVRYRLDGHSKTLSFDTDDAAQRWANIVRQIGADAALELVETTNHKASPTVDEWGARYIASLSGVEGRTIDHYRMFMRLHISPVIGTLPVDAITPQRIAQWVNGQDGLFAAKTIKNRHGFLSAMFQAAVDERIIDRNPCARTRLPDSEQREMVFLSIAEYVTLLSFIPDRHKPMIELMAATGIRWGEASALKWSDLDLRARTVRISRAWKHSEARGWYVGAPKTRRSRRTISLPTGTVETMRPLVALRGDWLFTNLDGSPIRHHKFTDNVWNPARNLANGLPAFKDRTPQAGGPWDVEPSSEPIGKWPGIHSLRHSHASWLIGDGVSMAVVQARLGHESIQTTIATYTHLTPDLLAQPADSIDRLLGVGQ